LVFNYLVLFAQEVQSTKQRHVHNPIFDMSGVVFQAGDRHNVYQLAGRYDSAERQITCALKAAVIQSIENRGIAAFVMVIMIIHALVKDIRSYVSWDTGRRIDN
jgi:hypothetical protein